MTPPVDRLEPRLLFTAAGFHDYRIRTVTANPGDDVIVVKLLPDLGAVEIAVNDETPRVFNLRSKRPAHNIQWLKIEGGDGNDSITVTAGRAVVAGGAGRDAITTAGGDDAIWGGPGSDTLLGGAGNDTILGGRGDDVVDGGDGLDWVFGHAGADTLVGGAGDDHLFGQDGNDSLAGGAGIDVLFLGSGSGDAADGNDLDDRVRGREYRRLGRLLDELVPGSGRPM